MAERAELVQAIRVAGDGRALARAVAALDAFDQRRGDELAASRELDLGARIAAQRLTPVPVHELHTAATDWLIDTQLPAGEGYRTAMIAEASAWYGHLSEAVKEDPAELGEQALGRGRTLASAYGSSAPAAEREFLQAVGYLAHFEGASGLPQIDQTVDPNNSPAPTPYPTEVFDNFAEEQDPFNQVESPDGASGASSEGAPMLQQLVQQQSGGSGYGSGPEKPDEHDTAMDTQYGYAEVPLGAPGQIPTAPAPGAQAGPSHPNPVAGTDQDAGAERRHAAKDSCPCCRTHGPRGEGECRQCGHPPASHAGRTARRVAGYSLPDQFGYRWATEPEIIHPFHERCGAAHWPDEGCTGREHTASVAIGYSMDLDTARRLAECERIGARHGLAIFQASATAADLIAHHNAVSAGWGASERTMEDTAVLHGFQAVVRPAMADLTAEARDFSEKQREKAEKKGDALPGPHGPVLPIENGKDLENAEHLKGRVKGVPESEISSYMKRKEKEFGHKGSRLDPTRAAEAAAAGYRAEAASQLTQLQQTVSPNNEETPQADELPPGVMFPIGPAFEAQWVTGPDGAQPRGHEAALVKEADWGRRHYEHLARTISQLPSHLQHPVADAFARSLPSPRNGLGPFDREKFRRAATDPGSYSWRSRSEPGFTREHHDRVAEILRGMRYDESLAPHHQDIVSHFTQRMSEGSRNFSRSRWDAAVGRPLPGEDGYEAPPRANITLDSPDRPPRRREYTPPPERGSLEHYRQPTPQDYRTTPSESGEWEAEQYIHPTERQMNEDLEYDPIFGWRTKALLARIRREAALRAQGTAWLDWTSGTGEHEDTDRCIHCAHRRGMCDCPHHCEFESDEHTASRHQANGSPMGDSRPAQVLPDGEEIGDQDGDQWGGKEARKVQADTWTQPHQSTDDEYAPYNSPATAPQPQSTNASPQAQDYAAGQAAGRADKAAGQRPSFADDSSGVSPYVKGYAEAWSGAEGPHAPRDVPASMGGDSGQAQNAQEAQGAFQVAQGARISAAFAPAGLMRDEDFRKGYLFASRWRPGGRLAARGSAQFEAGLYAGITDSPGTQGPWLSAHAVLARRHPELGRRIELHNSFTHKVASRRRIIAESAYLPPVTATVDPRVIQEAAKEGLLRPHEQPGSIDPKRAEEIAEELRRRRGQKTAGTSTDLITDGPGTSPDPMGSTPLNGPGQPPPMGGLAEPAAPGGAPPYQGAPPMPGGPVVSDEVMGRAQQEPQRSGPFTQTFSGDHPENAVLAPAAPDKAAGPGYSNPQAYEGAPRGGDRVAKLAAFRDAVQAGLARMGDRR